MKVDLNLCTVMSFRPMRCSTCDIAVLPKPADAPKNTNALPVSRGKLSNK